MPFATVEIRALKFERHCAEFPELADAVDYEARADTFLLGPRDEHTFECRRRCGHVLRYNTFTEDFGVLDGGIVLTFFRPDPVVHRQVNNWVYFRKECQK